MNRARAYRTAVPLLAVPLLALLLLAILLRVLPSWGRTAGTDASSYAGREDVLRPDRDGTGIVQHCRPGPWGSIDYLNTVIEAPEDVVAADVPPGAHVLWQFEGGTTESVAHTLRASGITAGEIARLMASASPMTNAPGLVLHPDDAEVIGLTPGARERLYAALSAMPVNATYRYPFRFETSEPAAWFEDAELSPETLSLLHTLVYRRGKMQLFSDHYPVLSRIANPIERRALMRALYRQSTMLLHIRVPDPAALDTMVAYWGAQGREEDVQPVLEALSRADPSWSIGLALLLPPGPRRNLYAYDRVVNGRYHDCHWTSMNFFNAQPDERFSDPAFVKQTILDHYARVEADFRLGDVILLRDSRERIIHSCNYIADNLVFTKNGGETGQPWILMNLDDLIQYYSITEPLQAIFLRRID